MVAAKGHDHVRRHMVVVELGRAMAGGVAVGAQHPVGAFVGLTADVPVAGARARHADLVVEPTIADLTGEHLLGHR